MSESFEDLKRRLDEAEASMRGDMNRDIAAMFRDSKDPDERQAYADFVERYRQPDGSIRVPGLKESGLLP